VVGCCRNDDSFVAGCFQFVDERHDLKVME